MAKGMMTLINTENYPNNTINKTLLTARLFDGFWDRWIAHGIEQDVVQKVKAVLHNTEEWVKNFSYYGDVHVEMAQFLQRSERYQESEYHYRLSGLYYNLAHWIFPERCVEKIELYKKSKKLFTKADQLSDIPCIEKAINIDGFDCIGRVRIPKQPKGCIIIINPIDSTKEELFTYEKQFIEAEFATVSFDGPGQGETLTLNGLKATSNRWSIFLEQIITLAHKILPEVSIHLFGTSSGAAWSIYGSGHPYVSNVVAVSPAVSKGIPLPNYFTERMSSILEGNEIMLPKLKDLSKCKNVLLFHGNKDVMVNDNDIYRLYNGLSKSKYLIEYEEEGHCCNNKLSKVRKQSMQWFLETEVEKND